MILTPQRANLIVAGLRALLSNGLKAPGQEIEIASDILALVNEIQAELKPKIVPDELSSPPANPSTEDKIE